MLGELCREISLGVASSSLVVFPVLIFISGKNSIPTRDPKQCGVSKRIMYDDDDVVVDDDDDDDDR